MSRPKGFDAAELLREPMLELLGDGEWHNYEQVLRQLGKLIPPGVAVRRCESDRRGQGTKQRHGRPAPPERFFELSIERQIESGRRSIVRTYLKNLHSIETDRPGSPAHRVPERRVRLKRR